jgi:glycosyltransferase involved in cell wall biosynthesis
MYREKMGAASWELHCCGKGEYETSIANKEGIVNHGFVQPADMEEIWYQSGVFILPSTFDPWPLALVEACAAGLPVICTASCGSAVELIRDFYNGIVVPPSNAKALFEAMCYTHEHHDELPRWGERGVQLAGAYSSEAWAVRWGNYLKEMIK